MARNPAQHPAAEQPGTLNSKERQKNKLRRPKAESTSHHHHLLTSSTGKLPALIWAEVILLINLSGTFIDAKERAWHLSSFHDAQETVIASKVQRFIYFLLFFPSTGQHSGCGNCVSASPSKNLAVLWHAVVLNVDHLTQKELPASSRITEHLGL